MLRIPVVLAITASICVAQTDPFVPHANIPAGDGTGSLTINDFNGDGKKDVAVVNPAALTITVLIGDGAGGFTLGPGGPLHFETLSSFAQKELLTSGDFDRDGNIDLAFTEHFVDSDGNQKTRIIVRAGSRSGSFVSSPIFRTQLADSPSFDRMAAVDINHDGKLDIVFDRLFSQFNGQLFAGSSYWGDGTGMFRADPQEGSTAFGDFNQDGFLDFVTSGESFQNSGVTIHLNNGAGGFSELQSVPDSRFTQMSRIEVVDYDQDGVLDLLCIGRGFVLPAINFFGYRGDGSGGFIPDFYNNAFPGLLSVGDFDGDQVPDWALASGASVSAVLMRLPARFVPTPTTTVTYNAGPNVVDMKATDLNNDSKSDLVVSNGWDLTVLISGPPSSKSSQTITFNTIGARSVNSGAFTPAASASSGLPVTIRSGTPQVCGTANNVVTLFVGGTCTLRAEQVGSGAYQPAYSVTRTFAVTLLPQTITVSALSAIPLGTAPFLIQAKANSGLPVFLTAQGACKSTGFLVTPEIAGTCSLRFTQSGNAIYAPQSLNTSFQITTASPQSQSIIFSQPLDRPLSKDPFTISASSTARLTLRLTSNTQSVCVTTPPGAFGDPTTVQVQSVGVGVCSITASAFESSVYYKAPTPVTRTFNILPAAKLPQSILPNMPLPVGDQSFSALTLDLLFSATSGLPVTVTSNTPAVCRANFSSGTGGFAFLTTGICMATASQVGDAFYGAADPLNVTYNIVTGPTKSRSIVFPPISNYPLAANFIDLQVSTLPSSGDPILTSNAPGICSVSGMRVSFGSTGVCSITASSPNNTFYLPAPPVTRTFLITGNTGSYSQAIVIDSGASRERSLTGNTFLPGLLSTANLPLTFVSLTPSICDLDGSSMVVPRAVGQCAIQGMQGGNSVYKPADPVVWTVSIVTNGLLQTQTIDFPSLPNISLENPSFSPAASASSALPITYTTPSTSCSVSANLVTLLSVGTCQVIATQAGNITYQAASASRTFLILPPTPIAPAIQSIQNGASYAPGILAPLSYGWIFGTNFLVSPTVTLHDASGTDFTLEQHDIDDTQINVLLPGNVALGSATVKVTNPNGTSEMPVTVAATSPGLFSMLGTGQGPAKAQIEMVNNGITTYFGVGDRALFIAPGGDVFITLEATGVRGHGLNGVSARIAGIPAQVQSVGAHPDTPGLDLVKLSVPPAVLGQGTIDIQVTVDGVDSNVVTANFGEPRSRYTRSR